MSLNAINLSGFPFWISKVMKKLAISLLVFCCVFAATITSLPQTALASGVYLNLKTVECPNISSPPPTGFYRYSLKWKSEVEVPSPPEANDLTKFWGGDCYNTSKVINVNEKFEFPVPLNMLVQGTVGSGDLDPFVIPATENYEDSVVVYRNGGYKTVISYKVTFE